MESIRLPDDILLYLAKFLSDQDCLSLSFSGAFERFALRYGEQRKLSISKCYSLTPGLWTHFCQHWMCSQTVTSFNASHCYWLPSSLLLDAVYSMKNLEELHINDTQITLLHLPRVFQNCRKIKSLALTLVEENLEDLQDKVNENSETFGAWSDLTGGFSRLTCLRVHTFALNAMYYIDSWLVILGVLGWCTSECSDLFIEISYTRDYFNYGMPYDSSEHDQEVIHYASTVLLPKLEWLSSLRSFVFVKRGAHKLPHDIFVSELLHWMFTELEMSRLQRLWVQEYSVGDALTDDQLTAPFMTSLLLGDNLQLDMTNPRFHRLQHLGGIAFSKMGLLQDLRYARGYCVDEEGLGEFCRAHPKLEHFCFDNNYRSISLDWKLSQLKVLVYACGSPAKDIVDKVVDGCPNVEALHIGDYINGAGSVTSDGVDFLAGIRFMNLKHLSFNGFDMFDGPFLPSVRKVH